MVGISRQVVGGVVVALVATACGSDATTNGSTTTSSVAITTTTVIAQRFTSTSALLKTSSTPAPSTTTISAATPSTTVAPVVGVDGCSLTGLPAGATVTGTIVGDVNGDGKDDTLTTYVADKSAGFRVLFGGGGGFQNPIAYAGAGDGAVKALGLTSLVGQVTPDDVTLQVFARVGSGASTQIVGLYHYENCALQPVNLPDGKDATFVVGGGVMHADGLACDGVAAGVVLAVYSANSSNGSKFATSVQGYRYANGGLTKYGSMINGTMNLPADSAAFESFATIDCTGIEI